MSFYTDSAKKFKFEPLPNNTNKTKKAFITGFANAVAATNLSAYEKVAWLKYAAEQLPQQMPGDEGLNPVEGPGPGFMPEGAGMGGGGGEEAQIQQLLESLPGNTPEEKLQAAVMMLMEQQQQQGGPAPGGGAGIEPDADNMMGGQEGGQPQIDPALLQQLLSQGGGQEGAGMPPQPGMPPQGKPPGQP